MPVLPHAPAPWHCSVSSPFQSILTDSDSGPSLVQKHLPHLHELVLDYLSTIESILYPSEEYPRRRQSASDKHLVVIIDDGDGVAFTRNSKQFASLHLAFSYCEQIMKNKQDADKWKHEISGVVCHELTHAVQHNGKGRAPGGLIEGIADYIRLQCGLAADHWQPGGRAPTWDAGYERTAYFLEWMATKSNDSHFIAKLNRSLVDDYDEHIFEKLVGKPIGKLWEEYKGQNNDAPAAMPTHQPKA